MSIAVTTEKPRWTNQLKIWTWQKFLCQLSHFKTKHITALCASTVNQYLELYVTGAKVQWRYLCLGHLSLLPLIIYLYLPFQIHIINTTWFVMHLIMQHNILWCFANMLKLHMNCIVILKTVSAQSFLWKFLLKKVSVSSLMGVMTLRNMQKCILVVSTCLFH